jgi:DNA-binding transcriptional ArsR family regulator
MAKPSGASKWTFLTNHGHVLLCLAQSSGLRLRDVAAQVGVTERAVQRIVADLEDGGYLRRRRSGRQNVYEIDAEQPLRHPVESHHRVGELIALSAGEEPPATRRRPARGGAKRAASR